MDQRLIGTWKLVSVKARDLDSGEERDAWGPNPVGYINYAPDGRMMVINARSGRAKPKDPAPTPQEAADLFQGMLAYAGSYTVNGNEVTHHVDVSWNEAWTGSRHGAHRGLRRRPRALCRRSPRPIRSTAA